MRFVRAAFSFFIRTSPSHGNWVKEYLQQWGTLSYDGITG
jgi:hypothetical protein